LKPGKTLWARNCAIEYSFEFIRHAVYSHLQRRKNEYLCIA